MGIILHACGVSQMCCFFFFFTKTPDGAVCLLVLMLPRKQNCWLLITQFGRILQVIDLHIFFYYLTGFFDDAKRDFQQALKLNPAFEDAKVSLQQTILDQQHKLKRGYWQDHKLWTTCFIYPEIWWLKKTCRFCQCFVNLFTFLYSRH